MSLWHPIQMRCVRKDATAWFFRKYFAESNLQSALAESQRGITELKDIVVKKLSDEKCDNPRLGFCDFLKVEVVQLTSDLYDEFQQETFNLVMRFKRRDKQHQMYQHTIGTSMAKTAMYSQALTSHQYPLSHNQMQAPQQQMQQTFTQAHAPAQQQIHGQAPQQSMQVSDPQ